MSQCVGHNKGSQLPFETQRESPEELAEAMRMLPYICNPLRGPSLCPTLFSLDNHHRTQLISSSLPLPQLSLQVSHAPFCLQSPNLTAGKQEPAGKATTSWKGMSPGWWQLLW